MSKEMAVIALGLWVVIVPYLGVPGSWRTTILVLSGIGIAVIGFMLRNEALTHGHTDSHTTFAESTPPRHEHEEFNSLN